MAPLFFLYIFKISLFVLLSGKLLGRHQPRLP